MVNNDNLDHYLHSPHEETGGKRKATNLIKLEQILQQANNL